LIMKIPVEIMVSNKRLDYREMAGVSDVPEPKESVDSYVGYLKFNNHGFVLDYLEANDGFGRIETSVIYKNGSVLLSRRGDIDTNLVFIEGKSCDCACYTERSQFSLRVTTKELSSNISTLGGKLTIDYTVDIMGNVAEKNTLCVSLCPVDSVS